MVKKLITVAILFFTSITICITTYAAMGVDDVKSMLSSNGVPIGNQKELKKNRGFSDLDELQVAVLYHWDQDINGVPHHEYYVITDTKGNYVHVSQESAKDVSNNSILHGTESTKVIVFDGQKYSSYDGSQLVDNNVISAFNKINKKDTAEKISYVGFSNQTGNGYQNVGKVSGANFQLVLNGSGISDVNSDTKAAVAVSKNEWMGYLTTYSSSNVLLHAEKIRDFYGVLANAKGMTGKKANNATMGYNDIINAYIKEHPDQANVWNNLADVTNTLNDINKSIQSVASSLLTGSTIAKSIDDLVEALKSNGLSEDSINQVKQTYGTKLCQEELNKGKEKIKDASVDYKGYTLRTDSVGSWLAKDDELYVTNEWVMYESHLFRAGNNGYFEKNYKGNNILTTNGNGYGCINGVQVVTDYTSFINNYNTSYEKYCKDVFKEFLTALAKDGNLENAVNTVYQKYNLAAKSTTTTTDTGGQKSKVKDGSGGKWEQKEVKKGGYWFRTEGNNYLKDGSFKIVYNGSPKIFSFDKDGWLLDPIEGKQVSASQIGWKEQTGTWVEEKPTIEHSYKLKDGGYAYGGTYLIDGKYETFDYKGKWLKTDTTDPTIGTITNPIVEPTQPSLPITPNTPGIGGGTGGGKGGGTTGGGTTGGGTDISKPTAQTTGGTAEGALQGSGISIGSATNTAGQLGGSDKQVSDGNNYNNEFEYQIQGRSKSITGYIDVDSGVVRLNVSPELFTLKLPKKYNIYNGNLKNSSHYIPRKEEVKDVIANLYSNLLLTGADNILDKTYSAMNREATETYSNDLPQNLRRMFGGDFYDADTVLSVNDVLNSMSSTVVMNSNTNWQQTALNGWILSSGGNKKDTVMKPEFVNMLILKAYGEYIYYSTYEVKDNGNTEAPGEITLYITRSIPQMYTKYKDSIFNCSYLNVNTNTVLTFNDILVYLYFLDKKYSPLRNEKTQASQVSEEDYKKAGINNIENQYLKEAIYYLVNQGMFTIEEIGTNFGKTLFQEDLNDICEKIYLTINRGVNINTRVESK